jgi:protein arginine N-methyltransferase 1
VSLVIDEHRQYLSDLPRVAAFRQAIREVVKPGDVVVDLGAGSGIMGLLACQAGAKRVYSIEETALIDLTHEISRANGFEDRMVFIKDLSTRIELPEQADVVVADQIGRFGFDAGIFGYFADARARFLKPGGTMIPATIDLVVTPVEHREMWDQVEFWKGKPARFDFSPMYLRAANTGYPVKYRPTNLLGKPSVLGTLDPSTSPATLLGLQTSVTVSRKGICHGIGAWFSARLSRTTTLTNSPLSKDRINRHNVFFPLDRPTRLAKGDLVTIRMHVRPDDNLVTWSVETVTHGKGTRATKTTTHSTFQGMLLCKEDLHKTLPQFVPHLSTWGEARLSILTLCDGRRALAEIEQEVYRRHADLFRSNSEAARFVAEVVTRYTQ